MKKEDLKELKNKTTNLIKEYLSNYKWLEYEIQNRRLEIIHPLLDRDENIGGGRSNKNTSQTEITAVQLAMDIRIAQLERIKWAIDTVYKELDYTGKQFMELYYFNKAENLTLKGVALQVSISEPTVKRLNKKVVMRVGELMGLI